MKGISNIHYWEKLTLSKLLGKKIWRNTLALKDKKVQGIFGETFILALLSSGVFRLQNGFSGTKLYRWQNRPLARRGKHSVNNAYSVSTVEPEVEPEVWNFEVIK